MKGRSERAKGEGVKGEVYTGTDIIVAFASFFSHGTHNPSSKFGKNSNARANYQSPVRPHFIDT